MYSSLSSPVDHVVGGCTGLRYSAPPALYTVYCHSLYYINIVSRLIFVKAFSHSILTTASSALLCHAQSGRVMRLTVDDLQKYLHKMRIKLRARTSEKLLYGILPAHRLMVRSVVHHNVMGIHHCDDPG